MRAVAAAIFLLAGLADGLAGQLTVEAEGFLSAEGQVLVAICRTSFDEAGCPFGAQQEARAGSMSFAFSDVPAGRYAIAVYHDVNGNGRMDTIPPGIPTEPYGFSNDVGRFAPPRFDRALVTVGEGANTARVRVRRLLQ